MLTRERVNIFSPIAVGVIWAVELPQSKGEGWWISTRHEVLVDYVFQSSSPIYILCISMNAEVQTSVNTRESDLYWRGIVLSKVFIADLLSQVNIVDIIRDEFAWRTKEEWKLASLRKSQKWKDYVSLCPFHQEKTPSFHVESSMQKYHCFACWADGDAIQFLQEYKWWNFPNTIRYLAEKTRVSLKYGNFYREDYFDQHDRLQRWEILDADIRYWADSINDIVGYRETIIKQRAMNVQVAIAMILWSQEARYNLLFGKKIEEIVWYNPDFSDDVNQELQEIKNEGPDYDDIIAEAMKIQNDEQEYAYEEARQRIVELKSQIQYRIRQLEIEKWEKQKLKEEQLREEALLRANEQRVESLSRSILTHQVEQQDFLESATYNMQVHGSALRPWSIGKFVCTYSQTWWFTCLFWDKRYRSTIPDIMATIGEVLSPARIADAGIVHKWIPIIKEDIRLWWAQFIVLNSDTICVSGGSTDFGSVPHSVVVRCLDHLDFRVIFLSDSPCLTDSQLYLTIQRELSKRESA